MPEQCRRPDNEPNPIVFDPPTPEEEAVYAAIAKLYDRIEHCADPAEREVLAKQIDDLIFH